MVEHAKKQQREIAKKRLDPNYKRDKNEAIASSDYDAEANAASGVDVLTDKLNSASGDGKGEELKNKFVDKKPKNTFQQMLAAQEMKGVTKTAPKKGMQLGRPKAGKKNNLLQELEK